MKEKIGVVEEELIRKLREEVCQDGCECELCFKLRARLPESAGEAPGEAIPVQKRNHDCDFIRLVRMLSGVELAGKSRVVIPEICFMEKGHPSLILHRKKEGMPFGFIRNREKLNFYEVKNYFIDSFIYHNGLLQGEGKSELQRRKQKELLLKNQAFQHQPFILINGQLVSPAQADNLFKSSSRQQRLKISFFTTFVASTTKKEHIVQASLPQEIGEALSAPALCDPAYLTRLAEHLLFLSYQQLGYSDGFFTFAKGVRSWVLLDFTGTRRRQVTLPRELVLIEGRTQRRMKMIEGVAGSWELSASERLKDEEVVEEARRLGAGSRGVQKWLSFMDEGWAGMKQQVDQKFDRDRSL